MKSPVMRRLLIALAIVAVMGIGSVAAAFYFNHFTIVPPPPSGEGASLDLPAVDSHIAIPVSFSIAALGDILEKAVDKDYSGGSAGDPKVDFHFTRGKITVRTDVPNRRIRADAPISGHIQVEGKVAGIHYSQGFDGSGTVHVSMTPVFREDWSVDPNVDASADVADAVAHIRTPIKTIDIGVTGRVRDKVNDLLKSKRSDINAKAAEQLKLRGKVEPLWKRAACVVSATDDPPVWVTLIPQAVAIKQFRYASDKIDSGIALSLRVAAKLSAKRPEVKNSELPALKLVDDLPSGFLVKLPVLVSYDALNAQLEKAITADKLTIPRLGAWVQFTGCAVSGYGSGLLLKAEFKGREGWFKSVSGHLYVAGKPRFDSTTEQLSVDDLNYTEETNSATLNVANWLASPLILNALKKGCVFDLRKELDKAKSKANEALTKLKQGIPKEIDMHAAVEDLKVDSILFGKDSATAVFSVRGSASASLH